MLKACRKRLSCPRQATGLPLLHKCMNHANLFTDNSAVEIGYENSDLVP